RRRHTISKRDWSSDVCSSDLLITRRHHQRGTWQRAVIPQHKSLLACDTCRIWGCGQLHIQGAVGAFQYRWLLKISTTADTLSCALCPPHPGRPGSDGCCARTTQQQYLTTSHRLHLRPSSRVRSRAVYSSVSISPRAYRWSRICRAVNDSGLWLYL